MNRKISRYLFIPLMVVAIVVMALTCRPAMGQTGAEVLEAVMGAIVVDTTWLELPGWHRDSLPVGSRPTPYGSYFEAPVSFGKRLNTETLYHSLDSLRERYTQKDSVLADRLLVDSMIRSLPPIDPLPDSWFYPPPPPCSVWVPGHWEGGK